MSESDEALIIAEIAKSERSIVSACFGTEPGCRSPKSLASSKNATQTVDGVVEFSLLKLEASSASGLMFWFLCCHDTYYSS